jgi:hypothetical protein
MLQYLERRASDRKLRLFAVACCRRAWHLLDARHCEAIEAAERVADGMMSEAEFEQALQAIGAVYGTELPQDRWCEPSHYMTSALRHLERGRAAPYVADFAARGLACIAGSPESPEWLAARQVEEAAQCQLIRDLFGNSSRPFRFDPDWLSLEGGAAVRRAGEVYRAGRFETLSSLGDLLEQADCRDRAVLDHCRGPGPHARGCWVVDALLGRETAVRTGLMTESDWRTCADPEPLLRFLREKGSARKWRLFAVACCGRIGHLMADERSRRAVEVAARYADGVATEAELEAERLAAQEAQDEAEQAEHAAEAEANYCITPAYAAACCRLYAASAARGAVSRDPRVTDAEPGSADAHCWQPNYVWAAAAVGKNAYANTGSNPSGTGQEDAWRAAESAEAAERQAQCQLLRDLFGEYLGPPGMEGGWLPYGSATGGSAVPQDEQWCLLPTPRNVALRPEWVIWNDGVVRRIAEGIYTDGAFDRLPILADALLDAGCDDEALLAHCRGDGPHVRGCWVVDLILRQK